MLCGYHESNLPLSQHLPIPLVMQPTIQYFGWGERGIGLFGSILHSWGGWVLTRVVSDSLREKLQAEKISLGPELCYCWGGMTQEK